MLVNPSRPEEFPDRGRKDDKAKRPGEAFVLDAAATSPVARVRDDRRPGKK